MTKPVPANAPIRRAQHRRSEATHARAGFAQRILRRREVEFQTGLSRSTIYQRMADGTFPAQVALGPPGSRAVGWRQSDIEAFLRDPANYRATPVGE